AGGNDMGYGVVESRRADAERIAQDVGADGAGSCSKGDLAEAVALFYVGVGDPAGATIGAGGQQNSRSGKACGDTHEPEILVKKRAFWLHIIALTLAWAWRRSSHAPFAP